MFSLLKWMKVCELWILCELWMMCGAWMPGCAERRSHVEIARVKQSFSGLLDSVLTSLLHYRSASFNASLGASV